MIAKQEMLHVLAVKKAHVLPVGSTNQGQVKFIGKLFNKTTKEFDILDEGASVPYHAEIVKHLKDGSLLALNSYTAVKAGVALHIPQESKK